MISRTAITVLSATLALAAVAPLYAAPTSAELATVSTATYHIERHGSQVLVKDANERMLAKFSAATSTIKCVIARNMLSGDAASNSETAAHQPRLTLEDQNGRWLWSTLVPMAHLKHFRFVYNVDFSGTKLMFDNNPDNTPPPDQSHPKASHLFVVLGSDGRPLSGGDNLGDKYMISSAGATLTEADGTVTKMQRTSDNSASVVSSDGTTGSVKTTDLGAIVNLNGTSFVIKKVVKDGKTYSSFPWNGHNVMVDQSCTLGFTSDGDLTVDVPSAAKTAASR